MNNNWSLAFIYTLTVSGITLFSFNTLSPSDNIIFLYDSKRYFTLFITITNTILLLLVKPLRSNASHLIHNIPIKIKYFTIITMIAMIITNFSSNLVLQSSYELAFYLSLALLTLTLTTYTIFDRYSTFKYLSIIGFLLFLSIFYFTWLQILFDYKITIHSTFGFGNIRYLNRIHTWTIIPTLYLLIITKNNNIKSLLLLFLACSVSLLVSTDARGETLAIICGLCLVVFTEKKHRQKILKTISVSVVFGVAFKYTLIDPLPSLLINGGELEISKIRTSSSGRLDIWSDVIKRSTFWGLGGNGFNCYSTLLYGPHNSLLTILVNWGVIPTLSYIWITFLVLKKTLATKIRLIRFTGINLLVGLAYSLVSGVFDTPLSQMMVAICIAHYWGCSYSRFNINRVKIFSNYRIKNKSLLIAALICLFLNTENAYKRLHSYEVITEGKLKIQFWRGMNCLETLRPPFIHSIKKPNT